MVWKPGPQDEKDEGVTVKRNGSLTARIIGLVKAGAHLNESAAEPAPVMVIEFVDQRAFGLVREAKPTAAYAPTMMRDMDKPMIRCGKYLRRMLNW